VLYGRLTSGDAGGVAAVATSLADRRPAVRTAVRELSGGAADAMANWRGAAAGEFAETVRATASTVTGTDRRLRTAVAAIRRAARAYTELRDAADTAIAPWRHAAATDPGQRWVLAPRVIQSLLSARDTYEQRLTAIGAAFDDTIDLSHVGPGQPWVPQGLAYLDGRDQLLVTSYDPEATDPRSRLTVVDNATGDELKHVDLGGADGEPAPNHVGGVEAHGDDVWVTSTVGEPPDQTSQLYRYSQQDIDDAGPGDTVRPTEIIDTDASSYVTYADGKLWVGQYRTDSADEPKLYGYDVAADGSIDTANPEVHRTPTNVQGAVVRDGEFVFAQSGGKDGSSLITQQRDWQLDPTDPFGSLLSYRDEYELGETRHGVEEIEEIDGDIVVLHESNADEYLAEEEDEGLADDEAHQDHLGDDITRLPLTELGLGPDGAGDGYRVDPESLRGTARTLDSAAATLRHAADTVSGVQLVDHLLGAVPAAVPFSEAATRYIADCGQRLSDDADAVHDLSDGLVGSAESYRRLDDAASTVFRW
jgi:uncharacterized protein YukE